MKTFGERLSELLKIHGLSQRQFAKKLGVTEQCISRYVNNNRMCDLDTLLKICLFLDVDPNYMTGYTDVAKIYVNK